MAKKPVKKPAKKLAKKKKNGVYLDVDKILNKNRELFLFDTINNKSVEPLIKKIKAMDILNHKPITLYLNSRGGAVDIGFALINTLTSIKSKVITVINTEVCSMGGMISIVGDERHITENGFWMGHDMSGGIASDYSAKTEARAEYIKKLWLVLAEHLKEYTDLSTRDINYLRNKELWLNAEECLEKGIVDKIIRKA